ncbi:MAG: hypothetical protein E7647_07125 [Ruminococcaceae bacterium]|nr:hypothetical protein [Oscillospiraceae bacterium]
MSKRITNVKKGGAKKVIAIVAAVLALVLVVGVVAVYNVIDSGFVQRNQVAMKSDNYEVSSAMMSYYLNTLYQNSSSTYASLGLDTAKPLSAQSYPGGGTWYDFYLDATKDNVRQLLVLCEAAKADGFKLDADDEHSAEATLDQMESMAKLYGVTLEYYLEYTYGKGVNRAVFTKCFELSEIASHYSEHLTDSYEFTEEQWNGYYKENKDTFNKVDYYSYTFDVEDFKLDKDATDEDKKAIASRLEVYANEMAAVTTADDFKAKVENYLKTDLYKDKTEEELEKEKVDIAQIVSDCLTEGATNSSETDLNKWLFDTATKANTVKVIKAKDGLSFTVALILPAENTDLEDDCLYRDTYKLKNFRYIPFLNSSYKDSAKDAKAAAEDALKRFKDDATEENFAKIADEFANTSYEGGLVEGADKGAISEEADAWFYDSARKKGDYEIIEVADKGCYLVYYVGDGDVKWQAQADNALKSEKYDEDYSALAKKYTVMTVKKGFSLVSDVNVAG